MKILTLKIRRKNKQVEEIKNQLDSSRQTISTAKNTTIDIRVRFVTKGSEWHMTIPTSIIIKEKENGVLITCYGQIIKPFLLSLAFGLFCPFPALVSNQLLIYLLLCLGLFAILFVFFMNRIVYTTRDYLKKLGV